MAVTKMSFVSGSSWVPPCHVQQFLPHEQLC